MQNVSFLTYFLTLNKATKENRTKQILTQISYAVLFAMIMGVVTNFNLITFMCGFAAFFASTPMQWSRTVKPNLTSLIPMSQKRKTVYSFLSIPATFVFSMIICAVMFFGIWLVSGLAAAAVLNDANVILSIVKMYTSGFVNIFADGYAAALFVTVLIFTMGAGMIYNHTDRKLHRNIWTWALFLVGFIGAELILQLAARYSGDSSSVHATGYAGMYIKYFPLPWLLVLLCAIASISSLVAGIYLVLQKLKPKNY